ncbi:hypothetical protein HFP15_03725 [Amycolatopsis sp. K13G38]|uniref:Uncharacterized protein n=1 Tax=Amycolatopsis acididurans TaxID=2724524 RepID=A0ABX1IX10_9PSEU|nr:hypothetical protein [Amycolatopsis acididurans]NKQ51988.1 hypothetical protein [Amycolatopsis acididurans]
MATTQEIERRVAEADAARSAQRSAAAQRIGELAQRRATVAEQLGDIERELGEALAQARDVIGIDELARFTDVPAADLTRWLGSRKSSRPQRKTPKPTGDASGVKNAARREPSTREAQAGQTSAPTGAPAPGDGTVNTAEPVTAEVG